jgi:hypothetical protein
MTYDEIAIEVALIAARLDSDELRAIYREYKDACVVHVHTWTEESLEMLQNASIKLHDAYKDYRR